MIWLRKQFVSLAKLAHKPGENPKWATHTICFKECVDGWWRIEVTNGKVAAIVCGKNEREYPAGKAQQGLRVYDHVSPSDAEVEAIVNEGYDTEVEWLLPADDVAAALKHLKGDHGECVVMANEHEAAFVFAGKVVKAPLCKDGKFPSIEGVMPVMEAQATFKVNALELLALLENLKPFLDKAAPQVEVLWYGDQFPMGVMAKDGNTTIDAMVMPILREEKPHLAEIPESQGDATATVGPDDFGDGDLHGGDEDDLPDVSHRDDEEEYVGNGSRLWMCQECSDEAFAGGEEELDEEVAEPTKQD